MKYTKNNIVILSDTWFLCSVLKWAKSGPLFVYVRSFCFCMLSQKAQTVSTNKLAFTSLRLQIGIYKLLKVCQIGPGRPGHEPVHSSFYND